VNLTVSSFYKKKKQTNTKTPAYQQQNAFSFLITALGARPGEPRKLLPKNNVYFNCVQSFVPSFVQSFASCGAKNSRLKPSSVCTQPSVSRPPPKRGRSGPAPGGACSPAQTRWPAGDSAA